MKTFKAIKSRAIQRKGGESALKALLTKPKSAAALRKIPDDRWLAEMTRRVFQAGFNWKVVDAMWPGFEAAFHGFDPERCRKLSMTHVEKLAADKRIVRNAPKIRSVIHNANFIRDLAREHGGAGKFFAASPPEQFVGLLQLLKQRADRLGLQTAQYFLRGMGVDGFILSPDVIAALIEAGVVTSAPSSKKAFVAVQSAFDSWREESGWSLTEISKTLSFSIGENRH